MHSHVVRAGRAIAVAVLPVAFGACTWFTDFKKQPAIEPWEPVSQSETDTTTPPRGQPKGERPRPPAIVTPLPPAQCDAGKSANRGSSARCIKTAPLPDKRRQVAEQKRKAAQEAELRRREAALNAAELQQRQQIRRPILFGRFAGPGRPMRGPVMGVGLHYKTF